MPPAAPGTRRHRRLPRRGLAAVLLVLGALWAAGACASPNRGRWEGTFSGGASGTVEFRIDTRGTELRGEIAGATSGGQPFRAAMEGRIRGAYFYANFEGSTRGFDLPVAFEGLLRGELGEGRARGDWDATLRPGGERLRGTWEAEQAP